MIARQPEPIDCRAFLERLVLFVDNEMDSQACAQLQRHLAECAPCLDAYHCECLVKTVVARSCCDQAPADLRERVLGRIRASQLPGDPGRLPWER